MAKPTRRRLTVALISNTWYSRFGYGRCPGCDQLRVLFYYPRHPNGALCRHCIEAAVHA